MTLMIRLSRLFKADMHAVLDQLEEPDVVLQQAIREMDEAIGQVERQVKARELEESQIRTRTRELQQQISQTDAELDLCFAAENEQLARTLLRRKLEAERLLRQLSLKQETLLLQIAEDHQQLESQRQRLSRLKQKADVFMTLQEPVDKFVSTSSLEQPVTEADIDIALLKAKDARKTKL
ncbi:phage shock protein A/transcriptional regulator [Oleiphilus messinensis]|uniref:Phage shock protein A/transcriptional regulator n=1 Tax=Oleiphilus messinensis TaxID=141451 RepID=A0A1Y0I333_9GAMM|nr:PspA/IM30 family protein [Oleiphilus messinensis]ARU54619.1 phage shock protein A/transcriptional regulator [Oleiphilus messinensis]